METQVGGHEFVVTPADIRDVAEHLPSCHGWKYITTLAVTALPSYSFGFPWNTAIKHGREFSCLRNYVERYFYRI